MFSVKYIQIIVAVAFNFIKIKWTWLKACRVIQIYIAIGFQGQRYRSTMFSCSINSRDAIYLHFTCWCLISTQEFKLPLDRLVTNILWFPEIIKIKHEKGLNFMHQATQSRVKRFIKMSQISLKALSSWIKLLRKNSWELFSFLPSELYILRHERI